MRISPFLRGMLIIAGIALVVVVANLETSLATAALLVRLAFFLAIAFALYMLWRDFGRREIGMWHQRQQWVFYGAIGLVLVDLGWWFSSTLSGLDALVFFVVAGVCVWTAYRVWREQRRYS